MLTGLNSKQRVLKLFKGEEIDYIPVFSGFGNITVHGLVKNGWKFIEIHEDDLKMAGVAASTFELFGFECAVIPFDVGVEAEALGSEVNFYTHHSDIIYPTVARRVAETVLELEHELQLPSDITNAGRIFVVKEALRWLEGSIGNQVAVGAWVHGPYALASQVVDPADLAKSAAERPEAVGKILDTLTNVLVHIIQAYKDGKADYITVREVNAEQFGPTSTIFKDLVQPHLKQLFARIDSPAVLNISGNTDATIELIAACGADAISLDGDTDIASARQKLGAKQLIFGDIDPGLLAQGTADDVDKAVKQAIDKGVNAVWPGSDLNPATPRENMVAMMAAARKYGKLG